ncbi:MAG: transposase [Lentisphaeria bacterium]|nr:transposase [Lentisphaeria bacterium]
MKRTKHQCTRCGSESVTVVPFRVRQIRGESLGYCRHVILEFTIHRVYCHECHHRELEHIHFLSHPKSRLTKSLERTILELRQHMSIKALADFYDLRWHTIKELEKKHLQKKYYHIQTAHIKAIGIDEIHVGRGMKNKQFLTIVRDLQSGAVIHVGEGKGIAALSGALKKLKKSKLKVVTMDMANSYYSWISENFPKAHIVFDHFHVIKLMNDKLDAVRRRLTAKMNDYQRKQIKGLRFICLMRQFQKSSKMPDLVAI